MLHPSQNRIRLLLTGRSALRRRVAKALFRCLSGFSRVLGLAVIISLSVSPLSGGAAGQPTTVANCTPSLVTYDIVYVPAPRFGDTTDTTWPEVTRPLNADPGSDLRLLHPNCTEEIFFPLPQHQTIVDAPLGNGVVLNLNVSFDGKWVISHTPTTDLASSIMAMNVYEFLARFRCGMRE